MDLLFNAYAKVVGDYSLERVYRLQSLSENYCNVLELLSKPLTLAKIVNVVSYHIFILKKFYKFLLSS